MVLSSLERKKAKGKETDQKVNPFDLKVNTTKFKVLNNNAIGTRGKPSWSKTRSVIVRKKTLLSELLQRGRKNEFIDRRFGEKENEHGKNGQKYSKEDRMVARFNKEQLNKHSKERKKTRFNLNDDSMINENSLGEEKADVNGFSLTHRGRMVDSLNMSDMSDEDEPMSSESDDETFSFGSNEPPSGRTRAEIMAEVMANSKAHKYERQKIKEENAVICDKLDDEFKEIAHHLAEKNADSIIPKVSTVSNDYNEFVRQLSMDKKVVPSDSFRVESEKALISKEKITQSLMESRKRMLYQEADQEKEEDIPADDNLRNNTELVDINLNLSVKNHVESLLNQFATTRDVLIFKNSYTQLVAICKTKSVSVVAEVIKPKLLAMVQSFHPSSMNIINNKIDEKDQGFIRKKQKDPCMPSRESLMLFHFIGLVFSTSDFQHPIVIPAQLIIAAFLWKGRLLKSTHLLSALFLIQTFLSYQAESKRHMPELLSFIYPLLKKTLGIDSSSYKPSFNLFPPDRLTSQSLHQLLHLDMLDYNFIKAKKITFLDLFQEKHSRTDFLSFMLSILETCVDLYSKYEWFPEAYQPFLDLFNYQKVTIKESITSLQPIATRLEDSIRSILSGRKPLQWLIPKVQSIPQFNPDFANYDNIRKSRSNHHENDRDREAEEFQRLRKAHKREMKGAKKELKKDAMFLAREKFKLGREADEKYKVRLRHVMGTISNDAAGIVKK